MAKGKSAGPKVGELAANAQNPRKITDRRLRQLTESLRRFGDLSGVVFNVYEGANRLVGGHQRAKVLDPNAEVVITHTYAEPTKTGTVREGYVVHEGERHAYREVAFPPAMEKAANLAANKGAGEFDLPQVGEWLRELQAEDFDLGLTMFGKAEADELMGKKKREPKAPDFDITETYSVLVTCRDEAHQVEMLERLQQEGVPCKPLIV